MLCPFCDGGSSPPEPKHPFLGVRKRAEGRRPWLVDGRWTLSPIRKLIYIFFLSYLLSIKSISLIFMTQKKTT